MNKKERKYFRKELRNCFESLHLPVTIPNRETLEKHPDELITSQICNDHMCGTIHVFHNKNLSFLTLCIATCIVTPAMKMNKVCQFLNLVNSTTGLYHYRICPCCNSVEIHASLHLPSGTFPSFILRRILKTILEETYLCMPAIWELSNQEGDEKVLFDAYREKIIETSESNEAVDSTSGRAKAVLDQIIVSLDKKGIPVDKTNINDNSVNVFFKTKGNDRFAISIQYENSSIVMNTFFDIRIPNEKISMMATLVNRINGGGAMFGYHYWDQGQCKVRNIRVIPLENGRVDIEEFESGFDLVGHAAVTISEILREYISSSLSMEEFMEQSKQKRLAGPPINHSH